MATYKASGIERHMTTAFAVQEVVREAAGSACGQIEEMQATVDKLVELVGTLMDRLPPSEVAEILNSNSWRVWESNDG